MDNPAAFPVSTIDGFSNEGMSLRDWFAGQAISAAFQHVMRNAGVAAVHGQLPEEWAVEIAYGLADAMLLARCSPPPEDNTQ